MSRPLRIQYPGAWYHVMNRGRKRYFNEPRNIAVYLTRHLRNDTLKEVGVQFNIKKSSSVSSIVERMKSGLKADRGLRMRIEELIESIIKSQEPA